MDPANKSPSLRGAQSTAYLGLLLGPASLPSCPIPLLWEVRSGPPGKVPLKNILHDYPHPLHLSLSRGQISLEPKQREQSNVGSRTKFRESLPHCCTEQFHFLMGLTCWPLFPHCACLPPLAAQLAGSVGVSPHRQTSSGSPSTGKAWRDRCGGRAGRQCRYEGFLAESSPPPTSPLLHS